MNFRDPEHHEGPFIFFDQRCKHVAVGTPECINLYDLENLDSNDQLPCRTLGFRNAHIIDIYCDFSKLFFVCRDKPKKLLVFNLKLNKLEHDYYKGPKPIVAVKSCKERLVIWTKDGIYIRNPFNLRYLHTIEKVPSNPFGVCAISSKPESNLIAFPERSQKGDLLIVCLERLGASLLIPEAHRSPLAVITFSPSGKEIATAGETGTLLRVFSTLSGDKLYEFRRGNAAYAQILSIAFSAEFLCCSSDRATIHIFKMNKTEDDQSPTTSQTSSSDSDSGWYGTFTSFLPEQMVEHITGAVAQVIEATSQVKNFAHIPFSKSDVRRIVGFTTVQKELHVVVAQESQLMSYTIPRGGGKCQLVTDHDLHGSDLIDIENDFAEVAFPEPLK